MQCLGRAAVFVHDAMGVTLRQAAGEKRQALIGGLNFRMIVSASLFQIIIT